MKISNSVSLLKARNIEKTLSKKILLANTSDKTNTKLGTASPSDPIYFSNSNKTNTFNSDIRYRNNYGFSPLTTIDNRNYLLMFSENSEIKKACRIIRNEILISNLKSNKYPVYPKINLTKISQDKQEVAKAIQTYLDEVFYPKLFTMFGFKKKGFAKKIEEFLKTGKLAFEIVYDNIKNPKEIVNIVMIDPATLQKVKENDYVFYIQQPISGNNQQRIMHENQIILIEWNEYDYGFVSYVDQLRRPFNIMRGMQTAKILWFAVKSQVRMHINLNLGDVTRQDAIQKLSEMQEDFANYYEFDDSTGVLQFNGGTDTVGYHEYYTAETANSGKPDIEEINTNGPDLTEVDSLQYFEKKFWYETEIPIDRIDPNSSETWGFLDSSQLKKTEINFGKFIEDIRDFFSEIVLKAIIIQLTLKEVEIGVDLSLLDSIEIEWLAFNQHEKLAELEVVAKKIEMATSLAQFGEIEDANGITRKMIPLSWIRDNYLDFTPVQVKSMEMYRRIENEDLGFNPDGTVKEEEEPVPEDENTSTEDETISDDEESITGFDDKNY